jgi:hypothetical protein
VVFVGMQLMRSGLAAVVVLILAAAGATTPADGGGSARMTLVARPTVGPLGPVELSGSVDSGRADEIVDIHFKDCGQRFFRGVTSARTRDGGAWSTQWYPGISTTIRAHWNDERSPEVTVRFRAGVGLRKLKRGGLFEVGASGKTSFWRKRVLIQQRRGGAWRTVRSIVLTEGWAAGAGYAGSAATFKPPVPKGSLIRAFLPPSQARPCYLAGVSDTVRT